MSKNEESFVFDVESLTIGELVIFEDETGSTLGDLDNLGAKALQALVLIMLKRTNPDATVEDAAAIKISAFSSADPKE